jgi:hypothetical protein
MRVTGRVMRLLGFEVCAAWRALVPWAAARTAIAVVCVGWVTLAGFGVALAMRADPRPRGDALVPLLTVFAGTSLAVAMATVSRMLERPDRFVMLRLAPIEPAWAVTLPMAAAALLTLAATLTLGMPAVVAAGAGNLAYSALVTALAVITALWIVVLAIAILAAVASKRGAAAAARVGRSSTGPVAVLMILAIRFTTTNTNGFDPVVIAGACLASAALLPAALRAAGGRWAAALAMGTAPRRSPEPRWGSPSWGRMLRRTPLAWSMLGVVPLVVSASFTSSGVALIYALVLPIVTMFHLVEWEDECPDRLRLAPGGKTMRLKLWLHIGVPASIAASAIGFAAVAGRSRLLIFIVAAWVGPLLFLITRRRLRTTLQVVLVVVASLFVLAPAPARAQARDPGTVSATRSTAVMRGRVLAAHTGVPLARARVRLTASINRQVTTIAADERGAFEFRDLKPGRYTLLATKAGFVQMQFGQRRAFVPGTPIEIAAGDELEHLDIYLPPGAAIDGRVLDEFGEPVVDAIVMTLRSQFAGGKRRLAAAGRVLTTNDRGEFHLFGLPGGTYYLSAAMMTGHNAGDTSGREGYAPTYFPGTVDLGSAQPIVIEEGEQRASADVVLNLVRTASVSGVARDAQGRAFGSGSVTVVNLVSGFPVPVASGGILADGSFNITNVPPGNFTIIAATAVAADGGRSTAIERLSIAGDDVTGLVMAAPRPGTLAGAVVREQGDTEPVPSTVQLRLVSADAVEDLGDPGTLVRTQGDGSFTTTARAGRLRLELVSPPPGWFVSRILQGDRDVSDEGIIVEPGSAVADVRVMLTRNVAHVTGTVTDAGRRPARDYTVMMFARERALWTFRSRYVAAVRPDQQGAFSIKGVPAGDYLIAAIDYVEQGEGHDPDFLESIRDRSQPVSVTAGSTQRLELQLGRRP